MQTLDSRSRGHNGNNVRLADSVAIRVDAARRARFARGGLDDFEQRACALDRRFGLHLFP
jgi:hypothetical protein